MEHAVAFSARDNGTCLTAVYYNPYPNYSFSTYFCVKKECQKIETVGIGLEELQREFWKGPRTKGIRFDICKSNKALLRYHLHKGAKIVPESLFLGTDMVELHMEKDFE